MPLVKFFFLCFVACSLVACNRQPSADWLVGQWQSRDWGVVYRIDEEAGQWTIVNDQDGVASPVQLTMEDGTYVLTQSDGSRLIIDRISDRQMSLYQAPAEGLLGLTAQLALEKVDE